VRPNKRAGAVAAMFMGLTIANVVGVPLATWAGDRLGWRASFWGIAGSASVAMAALRLTLPKLPAPATATPGRTARRGRAARCSRRSP
jgi:DHA1 family inner membrane transport protein